MSNKLKQAIAVQRQIPEHIRTNYPVFVEFVKMYYDFLQQSQSQQLESIRDIDTTLDEFINKFKDELSKNFPLEMAVDKRFILKHLREFYLSRGSESSYNFLFRVLFGKEAELFYPATQMLRVSDGKWKQDVSIFLTSDDPSFDLSVLNGKYIYITNTEGKKTRTFVENAVEYNDTIYEIFIQRSKSDDVSIGAVVSYVDENGVEHLSTILACPTKVKIYKAGKGFKVGQLYALKTQFGRGCVIKITKIDSEGAIKNIQIVRFGLDYKTKFWSYLSNTELGAYEYVHPARLNHPYNPADPAYTEKSGGFEDSGWASKQEYFYYDRNIPVGNESFGSDRFFANPDYVGNVIQQFYSDEQYNPIDDTVAILEVELGAVAHYPGYYMKADGFISDEVYIQDGKYYQSFSYVIRVEEELRKYADIVKALVHPAGMKLYAEYNIFNLISLTATTPKAFNVLRLPIDGHQPSQVVLDDRGYSYNAYTTELQDDGTVLTTPEEGAAKVYAKQGKAAFLYEKLTTDFINSILDNNYSNAVSKSLIESIANSDSVSKQAFKNFEEIISDYLDTQARSIAKNLEESISPQEAISKEFKAVKEDLQLIGDLCSNNLEKITTEVITEIIDENIKGIYKNFVETQTLDEAYSPLFFKNLDEAQTIGDALSNSPEKITSEIIDSIIEAFQLVRFKNFSETLDSIIEDFVNWNFKNLTEQQSLIDAISNETIKNLTDDVLLAEAIANLYETNKEDFAQALDVLSNGLEKKFTDVQSDFLENFYIAKVFLITEVYSDIIDNVVKETFKNIFDNVFQDDQLSLSGVYVRAYTDSASLADDLSNKLTKSIVDNIDTIIDSVSNETGKSLVDTISDYVDAMYLMTSNESGYTIYPYDYSTQLDLLSNGPTKNLSEAINNSTDGRIVLSPYGSELYFYAIDDYQTSTQIT